MIHARKVAYSPMVPQNYNGRVPNVHEAMEELASRVTTEEGLHPDSSTVNGIARYADTGGALKDSPTSSFDNGGGAWNLSFYDEGGVDSPQLGVTAYNTGTLVPIYRLRKAQGSQASPSALTSGRALGALYLSGHDGVSFYDAAGLAAFATENWSAGNHGTELVFYVIPNGSGSLSLAMTIEQDGTLNTEGNKVDSGEITSVDQHLAGTAVLVPVGISSRNATQTTAFAKSSSYVAYIGRVTKALSSVTVCYSVQTAYAEAGAGTKWAEVAIYKGTLNAATDPSSMSRLGYTDISGVINSTGAKSTSVTLTGHAAGDDLWVAFGANPGTLGTAPVYHALETDLPQSGVLGSAAFRPSTSSSPSLTVGTFQFVWCKVIV